MKEVKREILLAFWKVHILHHAAEGPLVGNWMREELRRHGYEVSPGTLYPILQRMEERGWLQRRAGGARRQGSRNDYYLTKNGKRVLDFVRAQVGELHREVVLGRGRELQPPGASVAFGSSHRELVPGSLGLREVERELVRQALEQAGGNQTQAARLLGISRDALRYRMVKFDIPRGGNSPA